MSIAKNTNSSLDDFLIKLGQARLGYRRKFVIMKKFVEATIGSSIK